MKKDQKRRGLNWVLLGSLYLAELCVPAILFSLYRLSSKPDFAAFLLSRPGALFLFAASAFAVSSTIVIHQLVKSLRTGTQRGYLLTLSMNVAVVLVIGGTGEVALRLFSVKTLEGLTLGGKLLRPRIWHDLAERHTHALHRASTGETYLVFDQHKGWTVGADRVSEDRLYLSSVEGIRSPTPEFSFAKQPASCRIAILGDSFAFGQEVSFDDSWGHHLELALGQTCQVLNFGVPGYGVDQMYLRYMKDVRAWNPDVVIFAFVDADVDRSMSVYGFLLFPHGTMPFPKPRFVLAGGQLSIFNNPLPEPEDLFAKSSIQELPFITYDRRYDEREWDRPRWRFLYHFYLFRFLISWYALWESPRGEVSDQAMKSLNQEILRSFLQETSLAQSIPLLIYLPFAIDYERPRDYEPMGLNILRSAGFPHVDLRPCLRQEPIERYFMPRGRGQHYSPEGNRQIARCVHDVLIPHLNQRQDASAPRAVTMLDESRAAIVAVR
jgi:hypothetical protein